MENNRKVKNTEDKSISTVAQHNVVNLPHKLVVDASGPSKAEESSDELPSYFARSMYN